MISVLSTNSMFCPAQFAVPGTPDRVHVGWLGKKLACGNCSAAGDAGRDDRQLARIRIPEAGDNGVIAIVVRCLRWTLRSMPQRVCWGDCVSSIQKWVISGSFPKRNLSYGKGGGSRRYQRLRGRLSARF